MQLSATHLLFLLPLLSPSISALPHTTFLSSTTTPSNLSTLASFDPWAPDSKYSTAYPGPIRAKEWDYYLHQYSVDWFRANLDSITATTCLCSSDPPHGTYNQVASFIRWDYHSHFHNATYGMHHICPPSQARTGNNHCWSSATGSDYHESKPDKDDTYCMFHEEDGQQLCVNWAVEGKRWMTFHGHKRNFDYDGIYSWIPEMKPERVQDVCEDKCRDLFLMKMDTDGDHDPSFIKTWFPPKPIPWT